MILAATALAQIAFAGIAGGVSMSHAEISALIQIQSQLDASISISPFTNPIGESVFLSLGIADAPETFLLASNNKRATLTSAIDTDDLTITVTGSIAEWPASGAITLDVAAGVTDTSSEIVYYEGKAGQVITLVGRGKDGASAKSFAAGSRVRLNVIAEHHNLIARTLVDVQTVVLEQRGELDALDTALETKLPLGGGTMTGAITLAGAPTTDLHAATKAYVDSLLTGFARRMSREYDARDYLVGDGVTDDTAALQSLFDEIHTDAKSASVYFDDTTYLISGALQDTSRCNAQVVLGGLTAVNANYTLRLIGPTPPPFGAGGNLGAIDFVPRGTIFKSTLATGGGTQPAMICTRAPTGTSSDDLTGIRLCLENLTMQTVGNPQITAINALRTVACHLHNVEIIAGDYTSAPEIIQPTATSSYGVILPDVNKSTLCKLTGSVDVVGFYTGIRMGELTHAENIGTWMCRAGLEFGFSYHPSLIQRLLVFWCTTGAYWTGVHPTQIIQWDNEHTTTGASAWYASTYDVHDAGNLGDGDITWMTVEAGVGRVSNFVVNGGTGLQIRELGT